MKNWKRKIKEYLGKTEQKAKQKPFVSLFVILGLLLVVIVISNYLQQPEIKETEKQQTKVVEYYSVGETPQIEVAGKVEKSEVVTIFAQSNGVVKNLNIQPGQNIYSGQRVLSLSTDYYGNNIPWLQTQLAQAQLENVLATYETQKETIKLQRDLANSQADNSEELRKITEKSVGETRELLELNETILADLNSELETATQSAVISQLQSQKAQVLSAVNQIKSNLRQIEYQSDEESVVQDLAQISKESTLKQLDIQEKSLELGKVSSELQLKIARSQAALMYPGSPISGVVEQVLVQENQVVNPGTPLAIISGSVGTTKVTAYVSDSIAKNISFAEPSKIKTNGVMIEVYPLHVSHNATQRSLHSVTYVIPAEKSTELTNQSSVTIVIPVGAADTNSVVPYLPIESVHQSELENTIFTISDNNTVESVQVQLGSVKGRYVEIISGIDPNEKVILDRTVIEGQNVTTK